MQRRDFINMLGAGVASLAADKLANAQAVLQSAGATSAPAAKPNFILIYPDSMGANAVGCYGNKIAKTPTMDALAAGGIRFTSCTAQNPLCFPSRASLHTGKYVEAHGCRDNGVNPLDPVHPTMARSLREAGYTTAYYGKPHSTHELDWNEIFDCYHDYNRYLRARGIDVKYPERGTLEDLRAGVSRTSGDDFCENVVGNLGRAFLQEKAKDKKPFFLMMSHEAPHSPWMIPPEDEKLYDDSEIPLLDNPDYDWENKPEWRMRYFKRRASMANDRNLRKVIRTYMTLVHIVDRNIKKLIDTLESTGLRENTIIILAADHGDHLGNHRQMGKCLSLDQSLIHIPFIFNCPSRWQPRVNTSMVESIDIFPTVCALAGIQPPTGVQGKDLTGLLTGAQDQVRGFGHCEEHNDVWATSFAVRDSRYKYVRSSGGWEELYDLENDPHEWRNVAADPALAPRLQVLKDEMLEWRMHCIDRRNPLRVDGIKQFLADPPSRY